MEKEKNYQDWINAVKIREDYKPIYNSIFEKSPHQEILDKLTIELNNRKEALIKQKLHEKGFGHLVDGIGKRMFPKIAAVVDNDWEKIYADDDTEKGCFIVAIRKFDFKYKFDDNKYSMHIDLEYHD